MPSVTTNKTSLPLVLIALFALLFPFQSCKEKHIKIADNLFKTTQNKLFNDLDDEAYVAVFKKELSTKKLKLSNEPVIEAYYKTNGYLPVFVMNHLANGDLDAISDYYSKANEHGIDPKLFHPEELKTLVAKLHNVNDIKTPDEAYHIIAQLELLTASTLIKYSNTLQFGVVNPKKIYSRYFAATKRPDSTSMKMVFTEASTKTYLDSIQPKNPQYLALQKAYLSGDSLAGLSAEETKRYLLVNMERLRWRNKPFESKYVYVNIPDYRLDVFEDGKSVLNMKVCVGQGRNMAMQNSLAKYDDTCTTDKPFPRETPQLNSLIHSVDVNPVWNIPQSIATKEIIVEAARDKFYLSNKNIDVYKDGNLVDNPEDIDWSKITKDNLDYDFKQRPGEDNSLGKIKFLFKNKSSVYLHDTPAKSAFRKAMRAVSHGCVRLGDPQALAKNLFGEGEGFDTIVKDMAADNPDPTNISLPKRTPIYITYVTCWADDTGALQYRQDVYGLDIVLYAHLQRFLTK
ncbi:L,D-transpeptidase family protein [Mucilaginibacter sp. FT3.2]|uniref:L,D-transpeptidase family protein n=1 Tax=Mucilaginibacter sp. FT3.2 TaxID=2723090 RepID=UPI00161D99A8|nr:L,D-transpeptidase family protein [Mucilaginibacter sp. FT3.2]MBB6232360.1 murein L,D-transpeptidase YcbB/YkuD [Mucilaginibacter sp. FT3.2]